MSPGNSCGFSRENSTIPDLLDEFYAEICDLMKSDNDTIILEGKKILTAYTDMPEFLALSSYLEKEKI